MDANIVVMGTESVGKSAITVRLLTRRFIGEYGDIESIYSHSFGREFTLNIWDSPYSEDLSSETSLFEKKVQWADCYVLVYSICDRASFNSVSRLIETIKSTKDYVNADKGPIVIVGNKRDLHHRRTVLSEEGRLLARNTDCHFYEVSAAEDYHSVRTVFHGLVDRMKDAKLTDGLPLVMPWQKRWGIFYKSSKERFRIVLDWMDYDLCEIIWAKGNSLLRRRYFRYCSGFEHITRVGLTALQETLSH
ncbi:ras-related and estrogen-regulated growth inhibitor-like protein [Pungitius pungitius]|uniref:ras-related and estrogen-regulated growth inhibitor-like protein n=1 Tax=Pungitius pungitius TaxID=134920 RepID=UPI002E1206AB